MPYEIPDFLRLAEIIKNMYDEDITTIDTMPGGLTNKNFKVTLESGTVVAVRVAGQGTASYINRVAEKHNATLMASIGVAPEIYYYEPRSGSQLVEFIDADTMHPDDFNNNTDVLIKSAEIMKRYHDSDAEFATRFDPIAKIHEYRKILRDKGFEERYECWDRIVEKLDRIEKAYTTNPPPLVACHNDTLAENFMYDGKTMRVIDWEYGGMNDRFYDICCVFVENLMEKETEEIYLNAYFGAKPTEEERARVLLNKFLVNAHWSTWSLVQITYGKDHDFYWEYGRTRAVLCKEYMADPDFDRYLDLIG